MLAKSILALTFVSISLVGAVPIPENERIIDDDVVELKREPEPDPIFPIIPIAAKFALGAGASLAGRLFGSRNRREPEPQYLQFINGDSAVAEKREPEPDPIFPIIPIVAKAALGLGASTAGRILGGGGNSRSRREPEPQYLQFINGDSAVAEKREPEPDPIFPFLAAKAALGYGAGLAGRIFGSRNRRELEHLYNSGISKRELERLYFVNSHSGTSKREPGAEPLFFVDDESEINKREPDPLLSLIHELI